MIGKILGGRYKIITKLGQGNFSTTFLAVDMQLPNNPQCVVKHLLPQTTDPLILEMARILFDNEAKVLNRLGTHDQIPRLLAHFEEDQEFYLVQEFIEGHDLSREITPGKQLSEVETMDLLQDILKVLVFVHQHKVIHRDIKPSNLIRRWRDGRIVLIDFGAVKEISSQVVHVQGQTASTVPVGTLGYMPSEQTQNKPRLCSDIYAVGIIGLKALTGLPALHLPEDPNTGEIIWRDRAQVSPEFAEVLDKMVCYHFSQRYQSADEALQALQSLTTPISLNEPTVLLQPKRRAILWQALIGLGITAVVATIILWPRDNLLTYDNFTYGVSVKYPQLWTKTETLDPITGSLATFMSPQANGTDVFQENLRLIVQNLAEKNITLAEYTRTSIDEIKLFSPDAEIIEQSNTQLANEPAHQVIYTGKEEGYTLKHLQIWTIKDNKVYIVTYTAEINKYSEYLRTVEKMINSFEIKSRVDDQRSEVSRLSKLRSVEAHPLG